MLRWFKNNKALPMAVCITLLVQTVWPAVAAAFTQYNAFTHDAIRNGKVIDADTGGLFLAMGRRGEEVVDTLPDFGHTSTNKYDFDIKNGRDTLYVISPNKQDTTAVVVAARIDSAQLDPNSLPGLTLWEHPDPFTHTFLAYDAPGLVAHSRDTVVFSHIIIDSSLVDSAVMLGSDTAAIETLANRINIRVSNIIENSIGVNDQDSLVSVYWDLDGNGRIDTGDSLIEPADWFTITPGETMLVLVQAIIPIVNADSSMDTVSLICRTRDNARGRHLTKITKDIMTIELMQAMDAMAWIEPDSVIAGAEVAFTYNLQLILGSADEFRLYNPFADPERYGSMDTRDYDSIIVDMITFGYTDTFGLKQDSGRLSSERDSATWYYNRATDTLYVKFADSYVLDTDTLRLHIRQYAPTVVAYDSSGIYSYASYEYPAVFDDHIDPTPADIADTLGGIPQVWVIPDTTAPVFSLMTDTKSKNILEAIYIDVTVRDTFANRILTYMEPGADITITPLKINGGGVSDVIGITIHDSARTTLTSADPFSYGYYDSVAATARYSDTVVIRYHDNVHNIIGFTDTLYWIDSIAPEMQYAATQDTNSDGYLDRLVLRFDSPIQGFGDEGFQLSYNYSGNVFIAGYEVVDDSTLFLNIYDAQNLKTGAIISVSYDSASGNLKDLSELENPMQSFSMVASIDSAAPVLLYAFYYDNGTGSRGDDTIQLVYSENMEDGSIAADPAGEFMLYDSLYHIIPGGFMAMDHTTGVGVNDDTTLMLLSTLSGSLNVGYDRMNMVPGTINDNSDRTITVAPGNQTVVIAERTPPQITWITPADSLVASEVTRLYVKAQITEWQGIDVNAVTIDWFIPEVGSAHAAGSMVLTRERPVIIGDSLVYGNTWRQPIDLTNYSSFGTNPIQGGNHVIFNVRAIDMAGNETYIAGVETVTIISEARWFHCSRGEDDGYYGFGMNDNRGPYDAWAYVPENMIIFDSLAIKHYYNGEMENDSLEMTIREANFHLNTSEHIARVDKENVKIHEYAIIDKHDVSRRYERNAQEPVLIEIYVDDLEDVTMDRLTLFRLNDYQVIEQLNGALDTIYGDGEWVPLMDAEVDIAEEKITYAAHIGYVPSSLADEAIHYGLGVYAVMEYTPPVGILTSVVNSPNPFDAGEEMTKITYVLTQDAEVTLTIYDAIGDLVWKHICKEGTEGGTGTNMGVINEVLWNGRNGKGRLVANGGYICRIKAVSVDGTDVKTRKIGVMK